VFIFKISNVGMELNVKIRDLGLEEIVEEIWCSGMWIYVTDGVDLLKEGLSYH
jgi:hypothetical protein